jgi:hypothetical protein
MSRGCAGVQRGPAHPGAGQEEEGATAGAGHQHQAQVPVQREYDQERVEPVTPSPDMLSSGNSFYSPNPSTSSTHQLRTPSLHLQ